jgi:hypothetical protein
VVGSTKIVSGRATPETVSAAVQTPACAPGAQAWAVGSVANGVGSAVNRPAEIGSSRPLTKIVASPIAVPGGLLRPTV